MQDNNGQLADSWEQSNSQFHGRDIFREICLFHGNVHFCEIEFFY